MIEKYIEFVGNKFIKESKEQLENIMDSFLELRDDGFLTYDGLSIINDPRESSDENTKKLVGHFRVKTSKIIDKTNIDDYVKLYDNINTALKRVYIEDFYIKNNLIKIIFNINEPSQRFVSELKIGDYFYYLDQEISATFDMITKDDFSFILKLYVHDSRISDPKESLIKYFKQFDIEYIDCIVEQDKLDQYIFKGNFI